MSKSSIEQVFGSLDVQETVVPFFCVSTNLSTARMMTHRDGPLTRAIRASISLPGVFPPVVMNGELLVDGGVLENLPVRSLKSDPGVKTVIAIDVAPIAGPRAPFDYGLALTGKDVLMNRLRGGGWDHPSLVNTVISSMLVGSSRSRVTALEDDLIDLYLALDLEGIKLMDFNSLDEAISRGRRDAMRQFNDWRENRSSHH